MAAAAEAGVKPDVKYDLVPTLAKFLDPHMVFPLLSIVENLSIYKVEDLQKARLALTVKSTQMDGYAERLYKQIHGEEAALPKDIEAMKAKSKADWETYMGSIAPLMAYIDTEGALLPEVDSKFLQLSNARALEEAGITEDVVENLFHCAKFRYESGEYEVAANMLALYRQLVPADSPASLRGMWGKFAADILAQRWEEADKDREVLRGLIQKASAAGMSAAAGGSGLSELEALQQRSWLLHWSLFVFALHKEGSESEQADEQRAMQRRKDTLIDSFLQESNLTAIQLNCPWLLRYLTAAVLTSKRRHQHLKTLLRVLAMESTSYKDPIIEFMEALMLRFDFEAAQSKLLQECASVLATDFILSNMTTQAELMEAARRLIFETYCRIQQKISLAELAGKLGMAVEEAERWVADLILTAQLDAKIDAAAGQVVMHVQQPSVYHQVVDKTRDLTVRTRSLLEDVERKVSEGSRGGGYSASGAGSRGH